MATRELSADSGWDDSLRSLALVMVFDEGELRRDQLIDALRSGGFTFRERGSTTTFPVIGDEASGGTWGRVEIGVDPEADISVRLELFRSRLAPPPVPPTAIRIAMWFATLAACMTVQPDLQPVVATADWGLDRTHWISTIHFPLEPPAEMRSWPGNIELTGIDFRNTTSEPALRYGRIDCHPALDAFRVSLTVALRFTPFHDLLARTLTVTREQLAHVARRIERTTQSDSSVS